MKGCFFKLYSLAEVVKLLLLIIYNKKMFWRPTDDVNSFAGGVDVGRTIYKKDNEIFNKGHLIFWTFSRDMVV